ncbi:MAG TPA: hypothetical protein VL990_12625 [Acidobacteriaceae bacterium]|nr:hypothetical protein [Acidobacteriaceae bacterium]
MSRWLGWMLLVLAGRVQAFAATRVEIAPIPAVVRSDHFVVTIDGQRTPVVHAASSYYLLNFDLSGPATVSVRAADAHYWDRGVEIQPMRYGIRPVRRGATITFRIPGAVKLSIARPGDHFADSEMLFLLGSTPEPEAGPEAGSGKAGAARIRYYGPGVHHEDIDAQSGDRIYLAPGAVVFGSLNIWQVHDVRIYGQGMVIYNGPQDAMGDDGWRHIPDWHCIVMDHARDVEIDGITCIVRSRTWQVQMTDSHGIGIYNVNIIGGEPHDANQDGMDFVGTSDATVRNCFIRASDDDFALMGNWDGYTDEEMRIPGRDVTNITVEDSVVSTSISNTVRVGWPKKTFQSAHVMFRNLDVMHTGYGGCVVPFAFLEMWSDEVGVESHRDYRLQDIRLEDFYSVLQMRLVNPPGADGITFSNIAAMDGVGMVPSVIEGPVRGVTLDGVRIEGKVAAKDADIPVEVSGGAAEPEYGPAPTDASWTYAPGLVRPGETVTFQVTAPQPGWHYEWLFGDGSGPRSRAEGAVVRHAFPDAEGTLLDGSGRFRVLLHATHAGRDGVWASQNVVVGRSAVAAENPAGMLAAGLAKTVPNSGGGTEYDGWVRLPADGGYTFTLLTSRRATLAIDDLPAEESPELRIQVCGLLGDAVEPVRASGALRAGWHRIRIALDPGIENEPEENLGPGGPMLVWQGAGILPEAVPEGAMGH